MNGGGAVIDFGCYGANLATWIMDNQRPLRVTALTQTNKPDIYPKVDDEATILIQYPGAQVIVQASWNWPFSRKDMDVYGSVGHLSAPNGNEVLWLPKEGEDIQKIVPKPLTTPFNDPFNMFAAAIAGDIVISDKDLSSLANNMISMEILDAAIRSSREGKTIQLSKD
jgi:predicted dehydrogenase